MMCPTYFYWILQIQIFTNARKPWKTLLVERLIYGNGASHGHTDHRVVTRADQTSFENFNKFLVSFDKNPFRRHEDKEFRKQMTDNRIAYTDDPMSLITAIVLIKRKFTVDEIIDNYYSNVNVFDNNLF